MLASDHCCVGERFTSTASEHLQARCRHPTYMHVISVDSHSETCVEDAVLLDDAVSVLLTAQSVGMYRCYDLCVCVCVCVCVRVCVCVCDSLSCKCCLFMLNLCKAYLPPCPIRLAFE